MKPSFPKANIKETMTEPLSPPLSSPDTPGRTRDLALTGMADRSKMVTPTSSSQAQQHSHPEDPEEDEGGKCPQWLEQQGRTAADGLICDLEKLDCRFHSLSEGENQDEENCLWRKKSE